MSNSPLVSYTIISPNSSARTAKIDTITIHHMACNASIEVCGAGFASRDRCASSNYGVGSDGRIGLYVPESRRSWCSNSSQNDNRAITIEVANDGRGPDWHVSDKALDATIDLCTDICKRNDIKKLNYTGDKTGNLTMHKWFAYTACPGPYLESKFSYIADEVNKRLGVFKPNDSTVNSNNTNVAETNKNATNKLLSIGDKVSLVENAKYINGQSVPNWLYKTDLYVRAINGNNVTISIYKTGAVTGIINNKYISIENNDNDAPLTSDSSLNLEEIKGNKENVVTFEIGDEVKLTSGAKYINGASIASFVFKKTLYVRKINGDNITVSIYKTGAVTGIVNKKYLVKC